MKYKDVFVIVSMLLLCFGLPVGRDYTSVYGNGDHSNHGSHGDMDKTKIRGVVNSVSETTISILNMDIDASTAEISLMHCDDSLSVDNIAEGDIIEAKGTMNDGTFVASMIKLDGAGMLEGTVEAVGTDTVTLLGKVIDTSSAYCIKGNLKVGKKATVFVRSTDTGLTALAVKAKGMRMMEME